MELTRKMLMLMMIQIRFTSPFLNPISQDTDQSSLSLQWTNFKKKKKNGEKISPLFGSFGLVPFFSVPPFGFYCCWPSIARSAKFLQTTQKQFRSAQTKCANMIT
jgi:hypothetical protein